MSLANKYPHLLKEFIKEKNPDINPMALKSGSNKKIWWRCNKNHEYLAKVCHRTLSGSRCPYCYGTKLSLERSLAYKRPDLCKEFHPIKNALLNPSNIHASSRIKVWWLCLKDSSHEWSSTVDNRNKGNGCPFCSNKKIHPSNTLAVLYPEITYEWNTELNQDITPFDVTPYSNVKVWWKCHKKNYHTWRTSIAHRSNGTSCPYCSYSKCHPKDSALAILSSEIINEWSADLNPNLDLSQIYPDSKINAFWKCSKDNSHKPWKAGIYLRFLNRGRCPSCYPGRRFVSYEKSLKFLHTQLSAEWSNENNLLPHEVTLGSGIIVKWQCPAKPSHIYKARIAQRVKGHGCPLCNNTPTLPEIRIYTELKYIYPKAQLHHSSNKAKIDVYLPEINTAIEWDSLYYHYNSIERDIKKSLKLLNNQTHVIRIRHNNLPPLNINRVITINTSNDNVSLSTIKQLIQALIIITHDPELKIKLAEYLNATTFINIDLYEKIQYNKTKPAPSQSLGEKYPNAHKIWHLQRNQLTTPNDVYPNSHEIVWWQCPICNYEWKNQIIAQIRFRFHNEEKQKNILHCPNCTKSKPTPQYNLAKLFPELITEISIEDNDKFNPNFISPFSGKKIIWKCKICTYKWETSINARTGRKSGCPRCCGKILTHIRSLAGKCPEAIISWDYEKNKVKPDDIFAGTHIKYFFRCSCGKSYERRPNKFITGQRLCNQC